MGKVRPSTILLYLLVFAVGIPGAQAQWATDGALVSAAPDSQYVPEVVTDGRGGAIIVFGDVRGGKGDIYIQRLDAMGVRQWGVDDTAVCTAVDDQRKPSLVSDDNGGAFMAWWDDRGVSYHTYAQHMDADGANLWTADGRWVDTGSSGARMVPDGTGGAIIAWQEAATYPTSIAAQRLSSTGSKLWPGNYITLGTGLHPYLVPDGGGGAVVGWARYQSVSYDYWVYGSRLDIGGNFEWPDATVSPSYGCTFDAQIATDGSGGGIWVWVDGNDVIAQRKDGTGALPWGTLGTNPFHYVVQATEPQVASDGAGGAFVVAVAGGTDIFLNRVLADGSLDWGPYALHLCDDAAVQDTPQLVPDGHGGVFVAWEDHRNSATTGTDIYAQHVDADGNPQWANNGVPISRAAGEQMNMQITTTGSQSAIIAWEDSRNGWGNLDIYAQAIHYDGSIGDPPMALAARSPLANELDVPLDSDITATFNTAVDPATLTAANMLVHGSLTGQHDGTVTAEGAAGLRFDPAVDFDHGETVTVVLTDAFESAGGSPLAPESWSFTTEAAGRGGEFLDAVSYAADTRPFGMCAGDIDGDGHMDLVSANHDANSLTILGGDGDGTFTPLTPLNAWDGPRSVIVADMDKDGDLEVITANYEADRLVIYLNNGSGGFPLALLRTPSNGPLSVCAGDFDDDGNLDLATANLLADEISVFYGTGTGNGSVSTPTNYAAGDNPIFITCGDLNGDGFVDLVTANMLSDDLSFFMNTGAGSFAASFELSGGNGPQHVRLADLDGDGDLDVVASSSLANEIMIRSGDGVGGFSSPVTYPTGYAPYVGQPSDVDGDGDLDLIHANGNSQNIWVRLNDGTGSFGAETAYGAGSDPIFIVAADFDEDGALDLATVNRYSDDFSVLLNHLSLSGAELPVAPAVTTLGPNVPNPFNPTTRIDYALKSDGHVRLVVYDARGREITTLVDEHKTAMEHSVNWDGRDATGSRVASGVYFYKLFADNMEETRKMVLVK